MEEGGLRKKKGFLGRTLFSSLIWSLWAYQLEVLSQPWAQIAESVVGFIRIISSNADNFAAIGRDATRSHYDTISVNCPKCKLKKGLPLMGKFVVLQSSYS